MKIFSLLMVCAALLMASGVARADASALPTDSIYRLPTMTLTDQTGQIVPLTALAGHPYLLGMFYGSCHEMCPVEIERIKVLQRRLMQRKAGAIRVVLVSFDSAHDTRDALRELAAMHGFAAPGFRLMRIESGDAGLLGGVLGIHWRALPDGSFVHNAQVSLIDAAGRIVARQDALSLTDAQFMRRVADAVARGRLQ